MRVFSVRLPITYTVDFCTRLQGSGYRLRKKGFELISVAQELFWRVRKQEGSGDILSLQ